jgi:hypothetical protein
MSVDADLYALDTARQLIEGVEEIGFDSDLLPCKAIIRGDRDMWDELHRKFNGV